MVAAALLSAAATPISAGFARRVGMVVAPRGDRWHRNPTPLLGGAAMALAVLSVLSVAAPLTRETIVIFLGAAAAFGLGLVDDFRHIAPATKLVGQVLVGSLLVLGGVESGLIESPPLSFVLTLFWVVVLMNALNLMDNMDGLAAGITVIAATVLGITALPENPVAALVAGATGGAALGFLAHNFHPARVFMGDAGSLLLGFLLASAALLHTASGAADVGLAVLGPLVVLVLPLFDTALVATSRRLAGIPMTRGGRDHTSHRLAALGLTDRGAVLLLYVIALAFAALGIAAGALSNVILPLVALGLVGLVLFGIFLSEVDVYGLRRAKRREEEPGQPQTDIRGAMYRYGRFGVEVGLDVTLLTVAYYSSYLIRFEGLPDSAWMGLFVTSVPIVVGAQLLALVGLRVYRALWRYLGVADAVVILRVMTVGTAAAALGLLLLFRFEGYSRAVFVLDWLLGSGLLVSARAFVLWLRQWFALRARSGGRRVLIAGATDSGAMALRLLTQSVETSYRVVGFLDDDPGKRYRQVAGVTVVGTSDDLEPVIERLKVDLVVLALEPNQATLGGRIRSACETLGVEWREMLVPT